MTNTNVKELEVRTLEVILNDFKFLKINKDLCGEELQQSYISLMGAMDELDSRMMDASDSLLFLKSNIKATRKDLKKHKKEARLAEVAFDDEPLLKTLSELKIDYGMFKGDLKDLKGKRADIKRGIRSLKHVSKVCSKGIHKEYRDLEKELKLLVQ